MSNPLEMVSVISDVMAAAQQAKERFPNGFAIDAFISLALKALIEHALRKGPPAGLAADLNVTEEQAQRIREYVLQRELAREAP